MANQRSKKKTHFSASTEKELRAAIVTYAKRNGIDKNTALRALLWQSTEREGIIKTPSEFLEEVENTKRKEAEKKKKTRTK